MILFPRYGNEKNVPTKEAKACAIAWIPQANEHKRRTLGFGTTSRARKKAFDCTQS